MSAVVLPALDERVRWSLRVIDTSTGAVLADHTLRPRVRDGERRQGVSADRGRLRLADGTLRPDQLVEIPDEHRVADSGLLYLMRIQRLPVADLALLVGAVSDNLATNALLSLCGLDRVRAVAPGLGYAHTTLLDYIRNERLEDMPWTPSYGTGAELCDLMRRLGAGEVVSPEVVGRCSSGWAPTPTHRWSRRRCCSTRSRTSTPITRAWCCATRRARRLSRASTPVISRGRRVASPMPCARTGAARTTTSVRRCSPR